MDHAKEREAAGEQNCHEKIPHVSSMGWAAPGQTVGKEMGLGRGFATFLEPDIQTICEKWRSSP
jgi:hypothetical protein